MDFDFLETPFGTMALAAEEGALVRLSLPNRPVPRLMLRATPLLDEAKAQLAAYFAGTRQSFQLPLHPEGTDFQKQVWTALLSIPYGQTVTYGQLARKLGCPSAARAVGHACKQNPLPILIPCHRIVAADGTVGGYAGGQPLKSALLTLEQIDESDFTKI